MRRGRRKSAGAVLAWVVVAALVVAVVLQPQGSTNFIAASHRQPDLSVKWHIGPTLRQLRANFAPMRRPPTAAERAAVKMFTAATSAQPEVPEYVRILGRVEGVRVYLVVYPVFRHGARGPVVAHMMVVAGGNGGGLGGINYFPSNYLIFPATDATPTTPTAFVGVVPDGVRSVRWQFACLHDTHASLTGCPLPYPRVADVPVHHNLAVLATDQNDWTSGNGHSYTGVTRVTWYGPAGMSKVFTNANSAVPFPGAPAWRR